MSLTLVIIAFVPRIVVATLTAFSRAVMVTLAGSMMPILTILPNFSLATSKPMPRRSKPSTISSGSKNASLKGSPRSADGIINPIFFFLLLDVRLCPHTDDGDTAI